MKTPLAGGKKPARPDEAEASKKPVQFLALAAVALVIVAGALLWPKKEGPVGSSAVEDTSFGQSEMVEGVPLDELLQQQPPERKSEEEQTKEIIADHMQQVEADPKGEDAPGLLSATANLYKQKLRNYAEAARHYEMLLADYPDWEGVARIYPELATCYEQLGDDQKLRQLYQEMMDRFPVETKEHQWAADRLGLKVEVPVESPEEASAESPAAAPPAEPAQTP